MAKWIVKQAERLPRYVVEAPEFRVYDKTVVFCDAAGAFCAAISDFEYVKLADGDDGVTVTDEED